jgi:energy-converting hydrogenase Eha subunit E
MTIMAGSAVVGFATASAAAVPANPIDPVVKVVQTAVGEVDVLLCELFGNSVLCGAT